jgi:carboxymethylenebutenolidase
MIVRIVVIAAVAVLLCLPARVSAATQTSITVGVHGTMHAELFEPDAPGPHPGLIVLHTSSGLRDADLDTARQLADEGYVCLVPAFMDAYHLTYDSRRDTFGRNGDAIFADLVQAIGVLKSDANVHGAPIGAIGFSNGGYFAVWLALTGNVQAGVSYYGAYSAAGGDVSETRFKQLASSSAAPILILHGESDDTVPVEAARRLAGILQSAGAPYEMHLYPDTGHSFDRGAIAAKLGGGRIGGGRISRGAASGNDDAAADAWSQTLAFFRKYLH